jgi:hypothetical protein
MGRRKYQINFIITISDDNERQVEAIMGMKKDILSGNAQRDIINSGVDDVKITFTEIGEININQSDEKGRPLSYWGGLTNHTEDDKR